MRARADFEDGLLQDKKEAQHLHSLQLPVPDQPLCQLGKVPWGGRNVGPPKL